MKTRAWIHRRGIMTHPAQWELWCGLKKGKINPSMSLRAIGKIIGVKYPQAVLHHLWQLEKKKYVEIGYWQGRKFWKLTDRVPPELQ